VVFIILVLACIGLHAPTVYSQDSDKSWDNWPNSMPPSTKKSPVTTDAIRSKKHKNATAESKASTTVTPSKPLNLNTSQNDNNSLQTGINKIGINQGSIIINQTNNSLSSKIPHIQNEPTISSITSNLNYMMVYVENPPTGDAVIYVNDKDIHAYLKQESSFTGGKYYHFEGFPNQLNLFVGNNKVVVKYGSIELPPFDLKYTEIQNKEVQKFIEQQQQIENLRNKLPSMNQLRKTKIFQVRIILHGLLVCVEYPPSFDDAVVYVNDKDIRKYLLESGKLTDTLDHYSFEGSPDQLNLQVGKNKIVVKYGNTIVSENFSFSDAQKREAKFSYEKAKKNGWYGKK
jgi:hypothetical protein